MNRADVVNELARRWAAMVENGEFDAEEMEMSLEEQINGGCQGWDCSLEEADINPDLVDELRLDLDDEEGQEEWLEIVQDAARRYLSQIGK